MLFKKIAIKALLLVLFIGFVACSDDKKDDNPLNPTNPGGDISIPSKTITGKLKRKVLSTDTYDWEISNWDLGAAKIKLNYSTDYTVAEAVVAADGSFTIVLPDKIKSANLFSPTLSLGITPSPANLKSTVVPLIITIEYKRDGLDRLSFVSSNILDESDISLIKTYFEIYCFDNGGTINGTSNMGDKYELNVSKGWNFMYWDYQVDSKQTFKATTTLPEDVIFYI